MPTRPIRRAAAVTGAAAALIAGTATAPALAAGHPAAHPAGQPAHGAPTISHVLLTSVDGLHQQDLAWYVRTHPASALARLASHGIEYSRARTPFPSDSFPGLVGQVTGGDPGVTGVYYDDTFSHGVFPPGTTKCTGPAPGGAVDYDESDDLEPAALDAGQGLTGLPGSILTMTGNPVSVIDPAALPVDPATCKPVLPNQYLQVNTVFNVARRHGLRTAWTDKHPAYQIVSGPSGTGVQDFFTPEINSDALGFPTGNDWTTDNKATMEYDSFKVQSVINEIDGLDHNRTHHSGVPAIFGMNFQTVSTAQKLPASDGLTGGYQPGGTVPGPLLTRALTYVDAQLGRMAHEIRATGLAGSTAIIVSAKHGQSPTDPDALARVDDGPIIDAVNTAWTAAHPKAGDLIVSASDDDGMLLWLSDRSPAAARFVKHFLLSHTAADRSTGGKAITVPSSGLKCVLAGPAAARLFGVRPSEPRHPDVVGVARHGIVYTGGTSKIAEHGGGDPQDRHVPILVVLPGLAHAQTVGTPVETTQIAPTILRLLGLNPRALQAVRIEHTRVLPA